MVKIFFPSLFCLAFFVFLPLNSGWLERKAEGWAWYEDMEDQKKKETALPFPAEQIIETPVLPPEMTLTAAQKAAQIRQDLEEKLAQAVLEPTEENIENYMREQQKWINQSVQFSTLWAKVLLQMPELDATTEFPTSQYGIQLYKQILQDKLSSLIGKLIPNYGLFFFYEGRSKSSQAFSLVVQEFAKKYGWQVIAVSQDGCLLEGFKDNHIDNGTIRNMGVDAFPSLFLVNPRTADIRPIAFGLVSMDRIENNIVLQFDWMEE